MTIDGLIILLSKLERPIQECGLTRGASNLLVEGSSLVESMIK